MRYSEQSNSILIGCMCCAQLFLKANVSVAVIADYIISHNYIGSVIKVGNFSCRTQRNIVHSSSIGNDDMDDDDEMELLFAYSQTVGEALLIMQFCLQLNRMMIEVDS